jgi:O-antigen/teichoic acid export membrane protein
MKELIKGASIIFFFKIIGAGSLFLINIIISNIYGVKYLGIYNLLFAMLQISSIFSRAGLDIYIVKIIPSLGNDSPMIGAFLNKVFIRVLILSAILSFVLFLSQEFINEFLFKTVDAKRYIQFTALLIIPYTLFTIIPEILRGFQEIKVYSLLRNSSQSLLILLFLGLILISGYEDPIYALYLGVFSSALLAIIILIPFLRKRSVKLKNNSVIYLKPILKDSYPMFLTSSMLFLMGNMDSFMIGYFDEVYQVGLYNACLRLSLLITFILTAINGFVKPKVSKLFFLGKKELLKDLYYSSLKIIWIIVIPIVIILYSFPSFFLNLFGEEFISAKITLIILNTSFLVNAGFGPVGPFLNMTGRHKLFMNILIISLIMNIFGNIVLIPYFDINGAAISTLISTSVWNISAFYFIRKHKII